MPSPFVYRSLQSIRPGFSVTKERCVMSIVFLYFVSGIVFSSADADFLPIFKRVWGARTVYVINVLPMACVTLLIVPTL